MKKFVLALLLVVFMQSCAERYGVVVSVYNPTADCVMGEWVCVDYRAVMDSIGCTHDTTIVVLDHSDTQLPCLVVGDSSLVFAPRPIAKHTMAYYRVVPGVPEKFDEGLFATMCDSVSGRSLVVALRK